MNLFKPKDVKDFFDRLRKKGRVTTTRYKDHKSTWGSCEKEIFTHRALKPLYGFYKLIQFDAFDNPYYQYIAVFRIEYVLGYSEELKVFYWDASKMFNAKKEYDGGYSNTFESMKVSHNEALNLLGQKITEKEFKAVQSIFEVNLPEKAWKFKAYDLNKLDNDDVSVCDTFVEVSARFEKEAFKKAKKLGTKKLIITRELIS